LIQEKAGQPVKMGSGKRGHNLSLYVDPEQMEVLEEIRWRERQSMSSIVRRALHEYIKAHGSGNDTFKLDNWREDPEFQAVPTLFSSQERWTAYIDQCDKKERLKVLKHAAFVKRYADSRI
jgi:hypothetical protein